MAAPNESSRAPLVVRALSSADAWDHENAYHWFSQPSRMHKLLAHYDLYRQIIGLPGHVLEFGVFKGASLIRFATFRQLLETDYSRRIIGFDAFGRFPTEGLSLDADREFIVEFERAGGDGLSQADLEAVLAAKTFRNIELVAGNVLETLPRYLAEHPETRVALLHLDMDVKEPTTVALDLLYERVVPGGLIVLDDYNSVAGETEAVDAFAAQHRVRVEKLPYYHVPSFIRRPG